MRHGVQAFEVRHAAVVDRQVDVEELVGRGRHTVIHVTFEVDGIVMRRACTGFQSAIAPDRNSRPSSSTWTISSIMRGDDGWSMQPSPPQGQGAVARSASGAAEAAGVDGAPVSAEPPSEQASATLG